MKHDQSVEMQEISDASRVAAELRAYFASHPEVTQKEVAERVGRSEGWLSKLKTGTSPSLTFAELRRLALAINLPLSTLLVRLGVSFRELAGDEAEALLQLGRSETALKSRHLEPKARANIKNARDQQRAQAMQLSQRATDLPPLHQQLLKTSMMLPPKEVQRLLASARAIQEAFYAKPWYHETLDAKTHRLESARCAVCGQLEPAELISGRCMECSTGA